MKAQRHHKPKISGGELKRVLSTLNECGSTLARVRLLPGGVIELTTTEGAGLTLDDDEAKLDRELAEHRKSRHG